jgi:cytochrome c oxidase subunit 3
MTTLPAERPAHAHGHGHDHGAAGGHAHDEAHAHDHPEHLAHHWDSLEQQFEAGKLGMWLFLATEVVLFGGLFCAYSVWRGNHPELFKYGSTFLETKWGAINTCVLILSSLTMAWGVTAAQQNKQGLLKLMLFLTLCGAAAFMAIKYIEYSHKFHEGWFPGLKFYSPPGEHSHTFVRADGHGQGGHGAADGHAEAASPSTPSGGAGSGGSAVGGGFELQTIAVKQQPPPGSTPLPPVEAPTFGPAAQGPQGLNPKAELVATPFSFEDRHATHAQVHPLQDPHRPANAHMFFNIYFMMTGLHGIHVLIGMIVLTWLLIRTFRGHFNDQYFTPIDLGGLYWHIVDLIWIFLFPLFYLI